ncbi:MAG: hypothetical protein DRH08_13955 [Deltaproteobacteria bacterium]|nr:MAG: hypothetical protein DRH08_13955 [Deltaproteobacteria bacterium]
MCVAGFENEPMGSGFQLKGPAMNSLLDYQTSCYSLHIQESLATIDFTGDIFELGTCLETKSVLMSTLHSLDESPEIRALLLLNSPGVLGDERYCHFVSGAIAARRGGRDQNTVLDSYSNRPLQLERMTNAINQIAAEILKFRKLLIVGFEGDVAPAFFGAALAADYRFATDEMTFEPSHVKLELPPCGGLGFFLPRYVGHTKTRDLLYSAEPVSARELLSLGLIDGHFPSEVFRIECARNAAELSTIPLNVIMGVKAITQFPAQSMQAFLSFEDKVMDRAIAARSYRKG